jgi:hypothetical protein
MFEILESIEDFFQKLLKFLKLIVNGVFLVSAVVLAVECIIMISQLNLEGF